MITIKRSVFAHVAFALKEEFKRTTPIARAKWQSIDVSSKPEMAVHELRNVAISVPLHGEDLDRYRADILPNLPWADNHFEERVCGQPINPGVEWANWPFAKSADTFREGGLFNHNYMERYWPKWAGLLSHPTKTAVDFFHPEINATPWELEGTPARRGIRHEYGDLVDMCNKLLRNPTTRQAVLPIYFPEDTGHDERQPCTLLYQFVMNPDTKTMDVFYPMRSCDYIRHWRDDVYLTVRLLLWVLNWLRERDAEWKNVRPGEFCMFITNLHIFRNDWSMINASR